MKCDFTHCIYNKARICLLDEVCIDTLGMCDSCEIVTIPEAELTEYKEKRLRVIEAMWKSDEE
jgi:hypothetical protein